MPYLYIANPSTNEQAGFLSPASNCITNMLKRFINIIMMIVVRVITPLVILVYCNICKGGNSIANDRLYPIVVENARLFLIKKSLAFLPQRLLANVEMRTAFYQNKACVALLSSAYFNEMQCAFRR
ncbi:MAG: hypothetical protein VB102_07450 [Paludibacter sp.]|nr:hypothetical protein [Paludibacter sp.]